jgi:hypothetical protein
VALIDAEVDFAPEDTAELEPGVLSGSGVEVALPDDGEAISVFAPDP